MSGRVRDKWKGVGDIPVMVGPAKTGVADQTNQHFTVGDRRRQTPKLGSQVEFIFSDHVKS